MYSQIFLDGVLNLFTDASIEPLSKGGWNGCAGVVSVFRDFYDTKTGSGYEDKAEVANMKILYDCTNNIAELTGILLGVEYAIRHQDVFERINLFSDSRISVQALRDWIFNWVQYPRYKNSAHNPNVHLLINTSGTVKNQVLIKNIINAICMIDPNKCDFNIYHCKGHATQFKTVQDTFKKFNGFSINEYDASQILYYNDMVDNATRNYLLSHVYNPNDILNVTPFAIDPTPEKLRLYHSIMKGG